MPEAGGDQARYADPQSIEGLSDGLQQVLRQGRSPDEVAVRQAHAERFTWENCAAGTDAVYRLLD
jgi:hypothetical protein